MTHKYHLITIKTRLNGTIWFSKYHSSLLYLDNINNIMSVLLKPHCTYMAWCLGRTGYQGMECRVEWEEATGPSLALILSTLISNFAMLIQINKFQPLVPRSINYWFQILT